MCFGPLKRVCHWGPLTALGIIKIVSFSTIHCNSQWWPPGNTIGGFVNSALFLLLSAMTILNFLTSIYDGPGYLPYKWHPSDINTDYLQFCNFCLGYKAPRSHHCKKCNRCVLKMDHHCPWINNCVGHKNHAHFTLFLFFAVCGCMQSSVILSCSLYRAINRGWYIHYGDGTVPIVNLGIYGFITCVFALGLSIGVVLAVGALLFFQSRAIIRNRTGIEDWILEKANHRRLVAKAQGENLEPFIYPYNLGVWRNITQGGINTFLNRLQCPECSWNAAETANDAGCVYLCTIHDSCDVPGTFKTSAFHELVVIETSLQVLNWQLTPVGNGITWEVVPGCDQHTLTKEQMEQKAEKRQRAKAYAAIKPYSGRWLPISHGFRVFFSPPLTDEYRLPLSVGDQILVTRWRRSWLFGEKLNQTTENAENKGWFPRCCVIEVTGDRGDYADDLDKKEN